MTTPAAERRLALLAIAAAALCSFAIGMGLALRAGPWRWADEHAHTGYLLSLADGRIPTLDTPIEVPVGADDLAWVLAFAAPLDDGSTPRQQVWVANHPPGAYLLAVPGAWWSVRHDDGLQVLMWQRGANVVGGALTVLASGLLARELSGRWRIGALAAGLAALSPHLAGTTASGLTDGLSAAALVVAMWAAARALRRDYDTSATVIAAAALAACGLIRISSLAAGGAAVALSLLLHRRRSGQWPWRQAITIVGPVAATSGWFYVLTTVRYGDPAASSELLDRFDRVRRDSWWSVATSWSTWSDPVRKLLTTFRGEPITPLTAARAPATASTVMLAVVACAAVLVWLRRSQSSPARNGAWWIAGSAALVTVAMTARHIAGGGWPHARYLLVLVPIAACIVAMAAVGLVERAAWRPAVAVGAVLGLAAYFGDRLATELPSYRHQASELRAHLGSTPWVVAFGVLAAVAFGGYLVAAVRALGAVDA